MSTFFEKNKRKSALALLLLLLQGRKDKILLLLLVILMMFLFVLPHNAMSLFVAGISKLPGGALIARKLNGSGTDFSALMAGFRAARDNRNAGWGVFFDADAAKRGRGRNGGASSIDMVKGGKDDMNSSADLASKVKGGESIGGVLTPEDSKKSEEGVAVNSDDMGGERAQLAAAGGMGGFGGGAGEGGGNFIQRGLLKMGQGLGAFGFGSGGAASVAAYAPKDMLTGGKGSAATGREIVTGTSTQPPKYENGGASRLPGTDGKLAAMLYRANKTKNESASTRTGGGCTGSRCAFHQLTTGRTQMMLSRDPICQPGNGCPPEFASTNVGSSFDGNPIGSGAPRVLTAEDPTISPQVDGITTPNINMPSETDVQGYIDEANELQEDAKKCQETDSKYRAQEEAMRAEWQRLGNDGAMNDCENVSCSDKSRAKRCKRIANQMKDQCRQVNDLEYKRCQECPLRARRGCNANAHDCS